MRVTVKNTSEAKQGVHTDAGLVWLDPGQQRTLGLSADQHEDAGRHGLLDLTVKKGDDAAPGSGWEPTGDKPNLFGKNKDALLVIAAAEGVTTAKGADDADVPIAEAGHRQIMAAIKAKREAA